MTHGLSTSIYPSYFTCAALPDPLRFTRSRGVILSCTIVLPSLLHFQTPIHITFAPLVYHFRYQIDLTSLSNVSYFAIVHFQYYCTITSSDQVRNPGSNLIFWPLCYTWLTNWYGFVLRSMGYFSIRSGRRQLRSEYVIGKLKRLWEGQIRLYNIYNLYICPILIRAVQIQIQYIFCCIVL